MEVSADSEACALLHMLEQLRQLLSDYVAVPTRPQSVEHAHHESRTAESSESEEEDERYPGSHAARGMERKGILWLHPS